MINAVIFYQVADFNPDKSKLQFRMDISTESSNLKSCSTNIESLSLFFQKLLYLRSTYRKLIVIAITYERNILESRKMNS